jgi:hypothetical protein
VDAANVIRLMSFIPERAARAQSGSRFAVGGSAKMELLCRFLHWLGPLDSLTKEDQQLLGVRAGGARPLGEGEGEEGPDGEDGLLAEETESTSMRMPGAGTHIAA